MNAAAMELPQPEEEENCELCGKGPCPILGALVDAFTAGEAPAPQVVSLTGESIETEEAVLKGDL
ncbi:hypothetical protein AB0C33_02070 [Nonomuraea sp. NPDC048881]|uniref:hypothetical protein n=1 Tax=Nonomuraea sp. NPDC048881 TaxID=3155030 RepID=UPI0033C35B1C